MTKEEATLILQELWRYEQTKYKDYEIRTALDMAVQALDQESCENCISRQAVIDGIDRYIEKAQSTGTKDDFISFAELVVKDLPPVTPQRKTGHWLNDSNRPDKLICSNCNCEWDMWRYESKELKYCPNCGADMRGSEVEE